MDDRQTLSRRLDVRPLLKPRSIAIVGASVTSAAATGNRVLGNLERFGFAGDLHVVTRTGEPVSGRASVRSITDLPKGVDLAVLAVPAAALEDAVRDCVSAGVHAAIAYASGFAEMGEEGRAAQERITQTARDGGLALLGPNCIGLTNFVDGVPLGFGSQQPNAPQGPALAILGQSGGMVGNVRLACAARDLPVAYTISTGNEAVLAINDFVEFALDDDISRVIVVFAEQIREPSRFLALASDAQRRGKTIVLIHPGRSDGAKEAAQSHTGSAASDHAVMKALVQDAGVLMVDTLDELFDVAELLLRFPNIPDRGPVVITESGAFKGLSADFADAIGLKLPALSERTAERLKGVLPDFATVSNPLDVTAQGLRDIDLYGNAAAAVLADPGVGSVMAVLMPGAPELSRKVAEATIPALKAAGRPVIYVLLGDDSPIDPSVPKMMRENGIPFFRSPDRALRALAKVEAYGRSLGTPRRASVAAGVRLDLAGRGGVLAEHDGKALLRTAGLDVPAGGLARTTDEAVAVAARVGYPVVAKAQSALLLHKSDVGGVAIGIKDEAELRDAFDRVVGCVGRHKPELELDGLLIEAMSPKGLELVVAARRDPDWGPVLIAGLGGVWVEALNDLVLMPVTLSPDEIAERLRGLKGALLLEGYRGSPPADVAAAATLLSQLGQVLQSNPQIQEIEINPLLVHGQGQGVDILDALVTISSD